MTNFDQASPVHDVLCFLVFWFAVIHNILDQENIMQHNHARVASKFYAIMFFQFLSCVCLE